MSSAPTPIPVGSDRYSRVVEWLYREAAVLDASDYSGWLELLAEDLRLHLGDQLAHSRIDVIEITARAGKPHP